MLKRWNSKVYDVKLLLRILEIILQSINIEERIKERNKRGRNPKRPPIVYVKALVLKEVYKASLRYSESLSLSILGIRIPKSTLNYWEINYESLIKEIKDALMKILNYLDYYYTVLDSTKFTDWNKNLHEVFLCVRVGEALIPVSADLTTSEVEFVRNIPSGYGLAFADGAFDAKAVLNDLVSKGYLPYVRSTKIKPDGYGARIRDSIFNKSIYRFRAVGEGLFGALTIEFGDRMKSRGRSGNSRTMLRLIVYCLKILVRWLYG